MKSSYLKYLPAIYQRSDSSNYNSAAFIGDYLKVFEKILSGIDDDTLDGRKGVGELLSADVIGNMFYPRFSFLFDQKDDDFVPPISALPDDQKKQLLAEFNQYIGVEAFEDPLADYVTGVNQASNWEAAFEVWINELVSWLGGWVNLVVNKSWTLDKKRTVVMQILALYRLRGTTFGLQSLLDLLLDLPVTLDGLEYDSNNNIQMIKGELSIVVSEPITPPVTVEDNPLKGFILQDHYSLGMPVVSGFAPWQFCIQIILPNVQNPEFIMTSDGVKIVLELKEALERLVEQLKPANSGFTITLQPSMQLIENGHATNLGNNTLLGIRGN